MIFRNPYTPVLSGVILLSVIVIYLWSSRIDIKIRSQKNRFPNLEILNQFNKSTQSCEDLVQNWSRYNMSAEYYKRLQEYQTNLKEATKDLSDTEGHSNQVVEEMNLLHVVAGSKNVKVVCETGFNYGHSTFNYLTSNPNLKVHTFDIGIHVYSKRMATALLTMFGKDRLTVHFGDSRIEIPRVKFAGELPLCDMILVDGGHTYPVARADLLNFASHANKDNIIIFDDYPTNWGASFGRAWEELLVKEKNLEKITPMDANAMSKSANLDTLSQKVAIVELLRCKKRHSGNLERGFVVGTVVRVPDN